MQYLENLEKRIQVINSLLEECMEIYYQKKFSELKRNQSDWWFLGDLVKFSSGGNPKARDSRYWTNEKDGIPWVNLDCLKSLRESGGKFIFGTENNTTERAIAISNFKLTLIPENSILLSCQSGSYEDIAIMAMNRTQLCFSPSVISITAGGGE